MLKELWRLRWPDRYDADGSDSEDSEGELQCKRLGGVRRLWPGVRTLAEEACARLREAHEEVDRSPRCPAILGLSGLVGQDPAELRQNGGSLEVPSGAGRSGAVHVCEGLGPRPCPQLPSHESDSSCRPRLRLLGHGTPLDPSRTRWQRQASGARNTRWRRAHRIGRPSRTSRVSTAGSKITTTTARNPRCSRPSRPRSTRFGPDPRKGQARTSRRPMGYGAAICPPSLPEHAAAATAPRPMPSTAAALHP